MLRSIFLAVVSEYQLPPCLAIIFFILRRTRLATWRQAPSVTLSHALFVAALMAAKSDPSSGDTPVGTQGAENSAGGPDRPSGWLQRTASPRYSSTQCAKPANPKSLIFCLRGSSGGIERGRLGRCRPISRLRFLGSCGVGVMQVRESPLHHNWPHTHVRVMHRMPEKAFSGVVKCSACFRWVGSPLLVVSRAQGGCGAPCQKGARECAM